MLVPSGVLLAASSTRLGGSWADWVVVCWWCAGGVLVLCWWGVEGRVPNDYCLNTI